MLAKRAGDAGAVKQSRGGTKLIFDVQKSLSMPQKSLIGRDGATDGFTPYRIVPTIIVRDIIQGGEQYSSKCGR